MFTSDWHIITDIAANVSFSQFVKPQSHKDLSCPICLKWVTNSNSSFYVYSTLPATVVTAFYQVFHYQNELILFCGIMWYVVITQLPCVTGCCDVSLCGSLHVTAPFSHDYSADGSAVTGKHWSGELNSGISNVTYRALIKLNLY